MQCLQEISLQSLGTLIERSMYCYVYNITLPLLLPSSGCPGEGALDEVALPIKIAYYVHVCITIKSLPPPDTISLLPRSDKNEIG